MNYLTEQLKKLGKSQLWLAEQLGEGRTTVNAWCVGRAKIPVRHREALESMGIPWPYEVPLASLASGVTVENVRDAWLIVGQALRESGRNIWMIDQAALGLYIGSMAEGLSKGESFEALKGRLLERARTMVAGLHRPAE